MCEALVTIALFWDFRILLKLTWFIQALHRFKTFIHESTTFYIKARKENKLKIITQESIQVNNNVLSNKFWLCN